MTPEAMRRVSRTLEIEKQFGIREGEGNLRPIAAPPVLAERPADAQADTSHPAGCGHRRRAAGIRTGISSGARTAGSGMPAGGSAGASRRARVPADVDPSGPLEAIALYERLLKDYPSYENSDKVLYQMARAYDELGRTEEAMATMERHDPGDRTPSITSKCSQARRVLLYPQAISRCRECLFSGHQPGTSAPRFYELALYKLGWIDSTEQILYEEALQKY